MRNIVLKFGLISGALSALFMTLTFALLSLPRLIEIGAPIGYAGMVLSFSLIFIGVRSYRESTGGGSVTFGKALQIGLLIALISSVCYALTWLVINYNFYPNFADDYARHAVERLRQSGASEAKVNEAVAQMQQYKEMSANPFLLMMITMIEPLPVGILVSLLSAALLKKKPST
jgi:hypothetical protein